MIISSAKTLTVVPVDAPFTQKPLLWIRTSAGPSIGFGHLKRAMTLAQALADCCTPLFLIDDHDCWSREQLLSQEIPFSAAPLEKLWGLRPEPAAILIDTRVTDGLELLIAAARQRGIPVVSIHDLGLALLPSDVLVDGSIAPATDSPSPKSEIFRGALYMVLDASFCRLHRMPKPISEKIKSVWVNLGGGDSRRYFLKIMHGLRSWGRELTVTGAPGFASWGQESLGRQDWRPLQFHWETGEIARSLYEADLAITAGGLSAYESLCSGTPLMALSYDAHQQRTIGALSEMGACVDLGSGDALDSSVLPDLLSPLETNRAERQRLSSCGKQIVDGRGCERVADIIRQQVEQRWAELRK
jgi:spore coat polysaccharide biosynthesis predicted glycosyltransferase SpsG